MKTADPYVLHLINQDFDIHLVPHSQKANAAIKRKAKARGMSVLDYLIDEVPLILMLSVRQPDPESVEPKEEEQTQSCA